MSAPASYVIGQPVVVDLAADGTVTFTLDLSDVDRARDIGDQVDWPWDQVSDVAARVSAAIAAGRFTVKADR